MYPDVKTKGFRSAIRAITEDPFTSVSVIPDAFMIDPDGEIVIAFEVEARHPVSSNKMNRYGDIFWYLDDCGWRFALITTDKFGNKTAFVDLGEYEARRLVHDARMHV
jgi:hypothetical protein